MGIVTDSTVGGMSIGNAPVSTLHVGAGERDLRSQRCAGGARLKLFQRAQGAGAIPARGLDTRKPQDHDAKLRLLARPR